MSLLVDDIVVNPEEVPSSPVRKEFSLSQMGLSIKGADFGESGVEGTTIRTATGQAMIDRKGKPRAISLALVVREDTEVDLPTAAHNLQLVLGALQQRDTWIRRDFHVGGDFAGPVLYRISGEVSLSNFAGWQVGESPDVGLTMSADFAAYSTEEREEGPFSVSSGARQLEYTLTGGIGTARGLRRIHLVNQGNMDGGLNWSGLVWAEESATAPEDLSDPTAQLSYLAKNLTPKGGAATWNGEGAEVVRHTALSPGWLTILDSEIAGVGHMTHRGTRRPWMRVWVEAPDPAIVQMQLQWRVLGATRWVEDNPIVSAPELGYCLVDLGEIRSAAATLGDDRLEWRLLARTTTGFAGLRVRDVYMLPTEQYLTLSESYRPPQANVQVAKTPTAVVDSNAIGTKAWTNPGNAKAGDLSAKASVTLAPGEVSHYLKASFPSFAVPSGARVTGIVAFPSIASVSSGMHYKDVRLTIGGAVVGDNQAGSWVWGSSSSRWGATVTPAICNGELGLAFAVNNSGATNGTFELDYFEMIVYFAEDEGEDHVCFYEKALELRSDGCFRQARDADVWAQLVPDGSLPYAVPGGLETRPSRGIVIASAGSLEDLDNMDGKGNFIQAHAFTRDGYHFAREAASS